MHIPDDDNKSEVNNTVTAEENLYDRLLNKKDVTDETVADNDVNTEQEIEQKIKNPEEKKRFKKLNTLGAKGITRVVDIGIANFANYVAMSEDPSVYRADEEDLVNFTEIVEEVIPDAADGSGLKIPLWLQLILFFVIAFVPVIFKAFSDRTKNKVLIQQKREIRKLRFEMKALKYKQEKQLLEKELLINIEKSKTENTEKTQSENNTENKQVV